MFSRGEIWLDASAVLPLLAEELIEDGTGQFQQMIGIARDAGLTFFVASGVIEELDHHVENALACCRSGGWNGKFPFLLEASCRWVGLRVPFHLGLKDLEDQGARSMISSST